jgi:type IV pilus assembly protein PilW
MNIQTIGSRTVMKGHGFTFVEVLVAMVTGIIVLGAVISIFVLQHRSHDFQEDQAEMVQTTRAALDMIVREIRMAGFDPTQAGFDGIVYNPSHLCIATDFRGVQPNDPPDGDIDDPNESIRYCYDTKNFQIDRNTGGGNQPFAENIQAFAFEYLDTDGNPTTTTTDIRQVRVTITARALRADPHYAANKGYRTYQLTSLITPMNLACP